MDTHNTKDIPIVRQLDEIDLLERLGFIIAAEVSGIHPDEISELEDMDRDLAIETMAYIKTRIDAYLEG